MKNYKKPTVKVQRRLDEKAHGKKLLKARANKEARQDFFVKNIMVEEVVVD